MLVGVSSAKVLVVGVASGRVPGVLVGMVSVRVALEHTVHRMIQPRIEITFTGKMAVEMIFVSILLTRQLPSGFVP